ncbi:MAG: hypothetical protein NXI21_04330 [Alphaproteobacteria bacterium]|nr:hypothetical protein [Alphaproteobacteria bacterium]
MNKAAARKLFRIERADLDRRAAEGGEGAPPGAGEDLEAARRHDAVMAALKALDGKLDRLGEGGPPTPAGVDPEAYRRQIIEAETLRSELQQLSDAIQRTKEEILTLRQAPQGRDQISTASEALRAVVSDTEAATDGIIEAAEAIEELGGRIAAQTNGPQSNGAAAELTEELGERVTQIFEHCNFQDITGQRITRVVQTMEFIDERVARMMEIWGGDDGFAGAEAPPVETAPVGEVLDGPSAAPEQKISQEDIDKLFD